MAIAKFSPKDPTETILVSFDYANLFVESAEYISGSTWTIVLLSGIDATPSALLSGNPQINGPIISHLITAGVNGCSYAIQVRITTNLGQVLELSGSMVVQTQ